MTFLIAAPRSRVPAWRRAAVALACLGALAARAEDGPPVALPAFHAGDHARYVVHDCNAKTDDRSPRPAAMGVRPPTCHNHDVDVTVLGATADGGLRARFVANGPTDDYPLAVLEQSAFAVRRAVAHGVPVELAIVANGSSATLVDPAALRARVKGFVESLAKAPAHADAAQVQRIVQRLGATSDAELLSAVWGPVKTLVAARFATLAPSTSADDLEPADGLPLPVRFKVDLERHVDVSALTADGKGLTVTTTQTLQGERAKAMIAALVEAAQANGPLSPRDESDMRDALAAPPFIRATTVTTIALQLPWPSVVAQTIQVDLVHEHERREVTFTRQ